MIVILKCQMILKRNKRNQTKIRTKNNKIKKKKKRNGVILEDSMMIKMQKNQKKVRKTVMDLGISEILVMFQSLMRQSRKIKLKILN